MTSESHSEHAAIELEVLRGSIRSRCRQAPLAALAMVLNTIFCIVLLKRGVSDLSLAVWLLSLTGLLIIRYAIARRARAALDADADTLCMFDVQFRIVSFASQIITGAGIWIVWGANDEISWYIMTLLICLYATGTMVNLAHDYRSFRMTIPFLMVQPVFFWVLNGGGGIAIAVILIGLAALMISSVKNSQESFDAGVRIRFEKDDLVRQLEREKLTAVQALQQAEAANRSKAFFMAAASHDLRQPLYAAAILRDTIALHALPDEARKLLDQQGTALATAGGLFDNLLDLSRFESGSIAPTLTDIAIRDLLRDVKAEFEPICGAKGLQLTVTSTADVVRSDYDLLDRLIRNLVSNAARYTDRGSVRIRAEARDGAVELTVEDTGIGIAADDLQRIFDEFVQLHPQQRHRDKGVGLGLAIVRHIAALLQLDLDVSSVSGRGTRIAVRLPLAAPGREAVSEQAQIPSL